MVSLSNLFSQYNTVFTRTRIYLLNFQSLLSFTKTLSSL